MADNNQLSSEVVTIEWPIWEEDGSTIKETIVEIIELVKKQRANEFVSLYMIMVGNKELNGLSFNYRGQDKFLNYYDTMQRGKMNVYLTIPKVITQSEE